MPLRPFRNSPPPMTLARLPKDVARELEHHRPFWADRFETARARAERRRLEWGLSLPEYIHVFLAAAKRGHCTICSRTWDMNIVRPSLDRRDPWRGYVQSNVRVICIGCNKKRPDGRAWRARVTRAAERACGRG